MDTGQYVCTLAKTSFESSVDNIVHFLIMTVKSNELFIAMQPVIINL